MKKLFWLTPLLLVGWLVMTACGGPAAPTLAPATTAAEKPAPISKPGSEWETLVAEAKKEGKVTVYTTAWPPEAQGALKPAFSNKYGIDVEFLSHARGAELVARVKAEHRAGLLLVDLIGTGSTTATSMVKPEGLSTSLEPLLILPEVKDPQKWKGGAVPFLDKEKQFIGMLAIKQPYLAHNTDLIKKGELTGFKDVLKPQYKDKISLNDPSVSGSGAAMIAHLADDLWTQDEAMDYLRRLIRDQKATLQRDNRIHVESVARGKFAIALGSNPPSLDFFMTEGAPLAAVDIKEGYRVTSAAGGIMAPTKMGHPNAAKVFLNWLLSQEGQMVFAGGYRSLSMRADVVIEGINPIFLIAPGEKVFVNTEEKAANMGKIVQLSKKVIDEVSK